MHMPYHSPASIIAIHPGRPPKNCSHWVQEQACTHTPCFERGVILFQNMLGLHVDDFFMGLSLPKKENVTQLINVNHNKTRPSHSPSHLVLVCATLASTN